MPVATIHITASPMYDLHSICSRHNIQYLHLQRTMVGRYGTVDGYIDTVFTPNKLAVAESLLALEDYWASIAKSKATLSILVRGSELEATEYGLAYCEVSHGPFILELLTRPGNVADFPTKLSKTNRNNSYLNQVLTDLYRIKPKEARPFTPVFSYLAGLSTFPKGLPPYLVKSLTAAEPIRTAVKCLNGDYSIEMVRAVSKAVHMDVFDINYTLARTGLLPGKDSK